MNQVILTGRLTKDVELRYTQTQKAVVNFVLAVDRAGHDKGADFIPCIAWDKIAEIMGKFLLKGSRIGVTGHIETGKYTARDGTEKYTEDVVVTSLEFLDKKADMPKREEEAPKKFDGTTFVDIPGDEDLPF